MTVVPLLPDRTQAGVQPLTNTAGNLDAALCENHPCRVTFSSFSEKTRHRTMRWTHLAANPSAMASVSLFCLFAVFAAIAWIQKRIWTFRVTGIIALVGLVAGLLLSHDAMM